MSYFSVPLVAITSNGTFDFTQQQQQFAGTAHVSIETGMGGGGIVGTDIKSMSIFDSNSAASSMMNNTPVRETKGSVGIISIPCLCNFYDQLLYNYGTTSIILFFHHSFSEKTPMCLINELARFNKMQHHYRLTDESGQF